MTDVKYGDFSEKWSTKLFKVWEDTHRKIDEALHFSQVIVARLNLNNARVTLVSDSEISPRNSKLADTE